jgi:hypothetical protein
MSQLYQQQQIQQEDDAKQLIQAQQTVLLSTVSIEGQPECSYAPYVRDQGGVFYIFVSELAPHTQNMLQTSLASLLFIQPEQETKNIFARKRVVFECTVDDIKQQEKCFERQLQAMREKFGETIDLLRSLSDFHLLALTPVNGKYITGFGQAFSINIDDD